MKKYITILGSLVLLSVLGFIQFGTPIRNGINYVLGASTSTIVQNLIIYGQRTASGTPCLNINAGGFVATTTCGSGGGTNTATATINGMQPNNGTFQFIAGTNITIATSTTATSSNVTINSSASGLSSTTPFTVGYIPWATTTNSLTNSNIYQNASSVLISTTTANTGALFTVASSSAAQPFLSVLNTGAVLISTSTRADASALSVYGTTTLVADSVTSRGLIVRGFTGQSANLQEWQNSAGTVLDSVDSAGNVGIGIAAPGFSLDIQQNIASQQVKTTSGINIAYVDYVNTGGTFRIGKDRSTGGGLVTGSMPYAGVITVQSANPLQFGTNSAIQMTLDMNGNLGIGTTAPVTPLNVYGTSTLFANSATSVPLAVKGASSQTGDLQQWWNSASTTLSFVNKDGYLQIGTSSALNTAISFDVTGGVQFQGSSTITTASLGGGSLAAGACASATSTIDASITSSTAAFVTTPQNDPGDDFFWKTTFTSPGVATTKVCAVVVGTPTATPYVVKIIR